MRLAALLLGAVLGCAPLVAQPPSPGGAPHLRVRIASSQPALLHEALLAAGYDCGHGASPSGEVELFVSQAEVATLQAFGLDVVIEETARPLSQKMAAEGIPTGYRDPAAILATLQAAQSAHPTLAHLEDIALSHGPGSTFEGRPIWAMKISDNAPQDEDEPNILIVSGHHAREIVTPEIALETIATLLNGYGSDPTITALVDRYEIWIAPDWNPDGLAYVWSTNNFWRKNRKIDAGGDVGVDQNRNYPLGWAGSCPGSTNPSSGTYRGPSAGSEEETQTLMAWSEARRFAKVLDFHSSGREVLQGYRCSPLPGPIDGYIDSEALSLGTFANYGVRNPSAEGEHYEWQIARNTTWSFLVETQTTFQPAYAAALAEFQQVWPLILEFMDRPIPISGHVSDGSGNPLEAQIEITGLNWQQGEVRRSHPGTGRYQLFLPNGSWELRFNAPGRASVIQTVIVDNSLAQVVDVALPPATNFGLEFEITPGQEVRVNIANIPPSTSHGLFLISLDTQGAVGSGPFAGLYPDLTSFQLALLPPAPGGLNSWTWPVPAPLFPATEFRIPLALVPLLPGVVIDGLAIAFGSSVEVTSVGRITL